MSESDEQKEIVSWFRETYPDYARCLRVSANGKHRGKGRAAARRIASERALGFVAGEADIAILVPRHGFGSLLLEHKAQGSSYKATELQAEYCEFHNEIGNCAVITRGVSAACRAIEQYMGP